MTLTFRQYGRLGDFDLVSEFFIHNYQPGNRDGNWLQPTWEYMNFHPGLDGSALSNIGIWEDAEEIVAMANYESGLGEAFLQVKPGYAHLKPELLTYAEGHLFAQLSSGARSLHAYVNDNDPELTALVQSRDYKRLPSHDRPLAAFAIPNPFPEFHLPDGFQLKSLADETDWAKVHRVMWRGFNHKGEPYVGEEELRYRLKMFDTPNASLDLKIVVAAPNGDFVSICGMWYEPINRFAYVEPVATDPAYRRLGLGRVAVLEGIRRCAKEGATVAYVGSDQTFYLSFGFEVIYTTCCWQKNLE